MKPAKRNDYDEILSLYEAHDFKGSNLVMSWGPIPKKLIMTDRKARKG